MNLKKLERYLRVNLLGPGPRLLKKEFTGPWSYKGWQRLLWTILKLNVKTTNIHVISVEKEKRGWFYRQMFSHNYEHEQNPISNQIMFRQGRVLSQRCAIIWSEHCTSTTEVALGSICWSVCVILGYDVTRLPVRIKKKKKKVHLSSWNFTS